MGISHRGNNGRTPRVEPLESRTHLTAVAAVTINGADIAAAGAQRSVIRTVAVRFDVHVSGADKNDLRLWNATTGQFIDLAPATFAYSSSSRTATWTFPAASGQSMLPNGNYRATLLPMGIYDSAGNPLDGDKDGVGGDEYNFAFHRFFGDSDGDRDADTRDYVSARRTRRLGAAASAAMKAAFDYDLDGDVDGRDVLQFRRALGRRLLPPTGNRPPVAPVIDEPTTDGQLIESADLHMQIQPQFVDPDSPVPDPEGQGRAATDWEVWTRGPVPERVFSVLNATAFDSKVHVHFGDGVFEGSHAGRTTLLPDTNYLLRVRQHDASGDPGTEAGNWDVRLFRTLPAEQPTAAGWVALQPGYKVQELPFAFDPGEETWALPTNIAFVPESRRGTRPTDPLLYVTELWGRIRVVTNDYHVHTYASGLLNYDPTGNFGGSGENGVTGIVVDPSNGDVFAAMLYDDKTDSTSNTFPKVTRFTSTDGGIHAVDTDSALTGTQGTDVLKMKNEPMRQSHIVSNLTFGPDDKLYVHVGDGFDQTRGQNDLSFRGKVLRMNRNGSAPTDNPHYAAADRGSDGLPDAEDYWFAKGLRNPFGGGWRDANPAAGTPAQHFIVENGPSRDRFTMLVRDRNYLYDGSNASMSNYNIAWSETGTFEAGQPDWEPSPAPVNISFVQPSTWSGSNFPASKQGHAFVTLSGSTHLKGPQLGRAAKSIQEWVIDPDGTRHVPAAGEPANPRLLVQYQGAGYSTAAALAAGPNGLYFSTLYPEAAGATDDPTPQLPGAKVLRVVYVGVADFSADRATGASPLTVRFTDRSDVPGATTWAWDFGDGSTSHDRNPTHVYAAAGSYDVKLAVTGINGEAEVVKNDAVVVSAPVEEPLPAGAVSSLDDDVVAPPRQPYRPLSADRATALLQG
jgi:glucose/arabinose dehydrogenase